MGHGCPSLFDTYVHRLSVGVVGDLGDDQQGDGDSIECCRRLVSAVQSVLGSAPVYRQRRSPLTYLPVYARGRCVTQ